MSRYFCPDCEDGQGIILDDDLSCYFCKGRFVWKSGKDLEEKERMI